MVFSISSRQSLEELKPVLELINEVKGSLEGWPVLLVGNKCDEESGKRQVSTKTGEALEVRHITCNLMHSASTSLMLR